MRYQREPTHDSTRDHWRVSNLRCKIRGVLFVSCLSPDLPRSAQTLYYIDHARNITLLPFCAVWAYSMHAVYHGYMLKTFTQIPRRKARLHWYVDLARPIPPTAYSGRCCRSSTHLPRWLQTGNPRLWRYVLSLTVARSRFHLFFPQLTTHLRDFFAAPPGVSTQPRRR